MLPVCQSWYDEVRVVAEDLFPAFALLGRIWWNMRSEISGGDRRFDGHGLELGIVITYAVYGGIACFSESVEMGLRAVDKSSRKERTLQHSWRLWERCKSR